jgi:hypothetical protein
MRHDFDAIPEASNRCNDAGSMLTRIYHDIGLAAVAEALGLLTAEFDPDLTEALTRGEFYLLPSDPPTAQVNIAA